MINDVGVFKTEGKVKISARKKFTTTLRTKDKDKSYRLFKAQKYQAQLTIYKETFKIFSPQNKKLTNHQKILNK